jgi:hypothetical protein
MTKLLENNQEKEAYVYLGSLEKEAQELIIGQIVDFIRDDLQIVKLAHVSIATQLHISSLGTFPGNLVGFQEYMDRKTEEAIEKSEAILRGKLAMYTQDNEAGGKHDKTG